MQTLGTRVPATVAATILTLTAVVVVSRPATATPDLPVQVPTAAVEHLPDSATIDAPAMVVGRAVWPGAGEQPGGAVALAWPNEETLTAMAEGTTFNLLPVARSSTSGDGEFTLEVDPDDIPAGYISDTGQVDLTVIGWNGDHVGEHAVSVTAVQMDGRDQFVDPLGLDPLHNDPAVERTAASRLVVPAGGLPATAAAPVAIDVAANDEQVDAPDGAADKPWTECSTTLLSRYYRYANIGDGWPQDSGQTSSFEFQGTQSSTLQTAYDISTDSGGWTRGGSVTRSAGFGQIWGKSSAGRYFKIRTEQGKYKKVCYIVSGGSKSYSHTKYEVRTIRLTGGTDQATSGFEPAWKYCENIAAGTWRRVSSSGKAYTHSYGLDISGIVGFDVTSKSQYDTSNELRYHQATNRYRGCGNNDWIGHASRVEGERR